MAAVAAAAIVVFRNFRRSTGVRVITGIPAQRGAPAIPPVPVDAYAIDRPWSRSGNVR
jgi:hypothetical protein